MTKTPTEAPASTLRDPVYASGAGTLDEGCFPLGIAFVCTLKTRDVTIPDRVWFLAARLAQACGETQFRYHRYVPALAAFLTRHSVRSAEHILAGGEAALRAAVAAETTLP